MSKAMVIFGILAFLLSGASLYFSFNTRSKIDRLNKRYNHLLRGHGDVNMEELLLQFGTDLDLFKEKDEKTDQTVKDLEAWVKAANEEKTKALNEKFDTVTGQLSADFHSTEEKLSSEMKRLDEQVYARMDQVEGENIQAIEKLTAFVQTHVQEFTNDLDRRMKKDEEEAFVRFDGVAEALKSFEKQTNDAMAEEKRERIQAVEDLDLFVNQSLSAIDQKTKDALQSTNIDLTDRMDRIEKETEQRLSAQEESQKKQLKVQSNLLKDQLSLAISKVCMNRYDAFEELSGKHSFSLVLLDEHRDGILLTSIYSSEGSNIFCKTIKNGESEQALSREESSALEKAIQK